MCEQNTEAELIGVQICCFCLCEFTETTMCLEHVAVVSVVVVLSSPSQYVCQVWEEFQHEAVENGVSLTSEEREGKQRREANGEHDRGNARQSMIDSPSGQSCA